MRAGPVQAEMLLKLRSNIGIEGDVELARMELEAILGTKVRPVRSMGGHGAPWSALRGPAAPPAHVRPTGLQGFAAVAPLSALGEVIRRASFVQHAYARVPAGPRSEAAVSTVTGPLMPVLRRLQDETSLMLHGVPHYAICEFSDVIARRACDVPRVRQLMELLLEGLLEGTPQRTALELARAALEARTTTSHVGHDLHFYKAKFFPRLARSMLNVTRDRPSGARVLDCFVGSGTTLVEASLLGMPSVGVDVDPLSVLIAGAKLDLLHASAGQVAEQAMVVVSALNSDPPRQTHPSLEFPGWLRRNRRWTESVEAMIADEIALGRAAVGRVETWSRRMFQAVLSDAVARRIRMRFLGTGAGRFSLTFSKRTIPEMLAASASETARAAAAAEWLRERLALSLGQGSVVCADARRLPAGIGRFDAIVTSPPYLPASSGRESYAMARAPSLLALGIAGPRDVQDIAEEAVGAMTAPQAPTYHLTPREREVVRWLARDPLRAPKAMPTARYFVDMRAAFRQMRRVLRPGGWAVVVSGKESVFYRFASRETLCTVPSAELLAEEAALAGFQIMMLHDIELRKADRNARPRSLDRYYETLIMLRRPE